MWPLNTIINGNTSSLVDFSWTREMTDVTQANPEAHWGKNI